MWHTIERISLPGQTEGFTTGLDSVDNWFRGSSLSEQNSKRVITWLCLADDGTVVGFFALKTVVLTQHPQASSKARNYFDNNSTGVLIAQMGISEALQGRGLGKCLLGEAISYAVAAADIAATRVVVLDAATPELIGFYQKFGFKRLSASSNRMYLPMSTARKIVERFVQ